MSLPASLDPILGSGDRYTDAHYKNFARAVRQPCLHRQDLLFDSCPFGLSHRISQVVLGTLACPYVKVPPGTFHNCALAPL